MLLQDKEANNVKCNTNIKVAEHNHYSRLMVSAESLLDSLCSNVLSSGSGWGCLMWVLGPPSNYCSFHCRFSQNLFEHNQFWHEWWRPVMTMFRANRNCVTNLPLKGRMKGLTDDVHKARITHTSHWLPPGPDILVTGHLWPVPVLSGSE